MRPTREEAWKLLNEYNKSDALLKHGLAVEGVMRHFAEINGEDTEKWGVIGLLHDLDYEMYPEKHCVKTAEIMRENDIDEDYIHAVCSHGWGLCCDVEPVEKMEKVLYTIDELTGLINAACLMRPSKSVLDIEVKSVKKKFKSSGFAAGVNREVIQKGCDMIGLSLDDVIKETIEGMKQTIATGPVAAVEIIKHLGTNGGGFFGANSTTPMENPTMLTNLIELYSMMLLPGACVITFGKMVRDRKEAMALESGNVTLASKKGATVKMFGREGRSVFLAMGILFMIGLAVCFWAESQGNPALAEIGLSQAMGSMEGKELRFGIAQSAMFTTTTTSFTTGTVNNMHDTLTPLGGMIPLLHMMLNVVFGGKGVGLMNMIMYAILAVFICGLMIGRTPEYLGKKIEGREMKLAALCIIIHPLLILAFSAIAVAVPAGTAGITNPGFHGLSQVLYEFASSAANNGSGFEGLADNSYFWNITTGIVMFFGRYLSIVIQLAIAGSLMKKNFVKESVGTLHTDNAAFAVILVFIVYIFAALTFFPALALGPIAEHLTLWA